MEYRNMGKWGAKLSSVGFGSFLNLGHKSSEDDSKNMIRYAYENGINFFDTADAYGVPDENGVKGQAEELLGDVLSEYRRSSLFILTKVFFNMGFGPNDRGLSAKHLKESCEACLKRLKTDYIDVFMCHRPDPDTPIEETVWAMEDLIRQGKILYWGTSQWSGAQLIKANAVAKELNARPVAVNEPSYNLLNRTICETDVFPVTLSEGIGNVTYSPLAHGMLTGKYLPGKPAPAGTRAAESDVNGFMMQNYYSEEKKEKCQEFAKIANDMGVKPVQLAIAWCLRRQEVTSVILGARRLEQLQDNIKASEIVVPEDVCEKLDELFPISE